MGKTVPEVLSMYSRPRAQIFPIQTDLGRQITCLFFSVGNYFIRNISVDFLLKQFNTVRVRLTFWTTNVRYMTGIMENILL